MRKTIYLSPDGKDRNDGTRPRPVASLARAVALSRSIPADDRRRRIRVADGEYYDTAATLVAADSGLEIVAESGARPAFYGGALIPGWQPEGGDSPFWISNVPGVRENRLDFRALLVNGRLAPRARFPETGAIRHASEFPVKWMSSTRGGWERKPSGEELTTLKLAPGSLPQTLSERNAELTLYHCWDESLVGVANWDRKSHRITLSTPAGHPPGAFGGWKEQARTFVVWNVREGMTRPGQWYLDRDRGQIVYWPLDGETPDRLQAIVPTRETVLRIDGTEEQPVCDIRIRGLAFGITTTPLTAGGFGALKFCGALEGTCAHGLRLEEVTARWSGGQGIRILRSNGIRCRNGTVHDTGAGGIVLSGRNGLVSGTLIHHNGRIYPSALALRVGGEDWHVHHNSIHHTPYSAVNASGGKLRFEHNRFHHVMEELLDGAAIYIFAAKNCLLRGNYTYAVRDGQVHAYYLDEQSENSRVEGNVSEGVPWPIHNHMSRNCTIRNNICLHEGNMRITFANCDGFNVDRNVFVCGGTLLCEPSYTGIARLSRNAFFSRKGEFRWTFHDRLPSLERNACPVPALPRNTGSVVADPGCDCKEGKVAFSNLEIAGKLGLRELDLSRSGCGRE